MTAFGAELGVPQARRGECCPFEDDAVSDNGGRLFGKLTLLLGVSERYFATNSKMTPQTVAVTPAISCGLRSSLLRNTRLSSRVTNG